jgi:hypothetical protein
MLKGDRADYAYIYFNVDAGGLEFRKYDVDYFDDDGSRIPLYEMVVRFSPKSEKYVAYWAGLGITKAPSSPPYPEYATAEVWTPHPDPKKARYAWKFVSRLPDLNTQDCEFSIAIAKVLRQNEKVLNVIVVSKKGSHPIALVELADGVTKEAATDILRKTVASENEKLPEDARIAESHLILVEYGGFVRSSESNLLRKQTEEKYAAEICAARGAERPVVVVGRPRYESIIETVEVVVVGDGQNYG